MTLAAAPPFEPGDRGDDSCSYGGSYHPKIVRQLRNVADVSAEIKSEQRPDEHPERAAQGVKQQKSWPLHSERPGHNAVKLAQDGEEAGKADGDLPADTPVTQLVSNPRNVAPVPLRPGLRRQRPVGDQ